MGCNYSGSHSELPEFPIRPGWLLGMGHFTGCWCSGVVLYDDLYTALRCIYLVVMVMNDSFEPTAHPFPLHPVNCPSGCAGTFLAVCEVFYLLFGVGVGVSRSGECARAVLFMPAGSDPSGLDGLLGGFKLRRLNYDFFLCRADERVP